MSDSAESRPEDAAPKIGTCGTFVFFVVSGLIALAMAVGTAVTSGDPDSTAPALMWGMALGAGTAAAHAVLVLLSRRYRTARSWIPSTGFVVAFSLAFSVWIERVTPSLKTTVLAAMGLFIIAFWPLDLLARRVAPREGSQSSKGAAAGNT